MDNPGRLFDQIAAEAGITANRAKVAIYLMGLARDGRSLEYAACAVRRSTDTVKVYAREFLIDFPDYQPFSRSRNKGVEVEPKTLLSA